MAYCIQGDPGKPGEQGSPGPPGQRVSTINNNNNTITKHNKSCLMHSSCNLGFYVGSTWKGRGGWATWSHWSSSKFVTLHSDPLFLSILNYNDVKTSNNSPGCFTSILQGPAGDRGEQGPPGMHGFQVRLIVTTS